MATSSAIFSTGCKGYALEQQASSHYCCRIDVLLDGGLYTGEITELVGQPSTGKTQVCCVGGRSRCLKLMPSLQLCMSIASNMVTTNPSTTIAYIDSSSTFSPERVIDMQSSTTVWLISQQTHKHHFANIIQTQEMVSFLNHIECYKCFDAFALVDILYTLEAGLKSKVFFFVERKGVGDRGRLWFVAYCLYITSGHTLFQISEIGYCGFTGCADGAYYWW